MTEIVQLNDFSLLAQGPTLTLGLAPGQSLAVVGPAASGKSRLLKCLSGAEKPAQGRIHVISKPALASREGFSKRSTPQSILRHAIGSAKTNNAAEALTCCGLWDSRQRHMGDLSGSQLAACELLSCLGIESRLLVIDGQLDRLDPWTLSTVLEKLRARLMAGAALVLVTNRPELLTQFDCVMVLDRLRVLYAGPTAGLLKQGPHAEVEVESQLQSGVRALTEPFTIQVEEKHGGSVFRAEDGQELAAKLLLDGYGDVRYVVVRQPSAERALMHLTRTPVRQLTR